jgi:hypothetical protein
MGASMWSFAWLLPPVIGGLFLGRVLGIAKHTFGDLRFLLYSKQDAQKRHWGVAVCVVFWVWVVWCESRHEADLAFTQLKGPRIIFAVNRGNTHRPWKEVLFGGRMSHSVYDRMHGRLMQMLV